MYLGYSMGAPQWGQNLLSLTGSGGGLLPDGLAGFQLRDLRLGGVHGLHQVPDRVGDLALVLADKPLADGAVVLVHLPLLPGDRHVHLYGLHGVLRPVRRHGGYVLGFLAQFIKRNCHIFETPFSMIRLCASL